MTVNHVGADSNSVGHPKTKLMLKNFLQIIADKIIDQIRKSDSIDRINYYYVMGLEFDNFCRSIFNIELD